MRIFRSDPESAVLQGRQTYDEGPAQTKKKINSFPVGLTVIPKSTRILPTVSRANEESTVPSLYLVRQKVLVFRMEWWNIM